MRLPILTVLGAFLFVAVSGPFVLMFAGPALTGDADAAQVGLYLLLHVNPVAIPSLLVLLGIAWAFRFRATSPIPSTPAVVAAPRPPSRAHRPAIAAPVHRAPRHRDMVIDVVAVQADARPCFRSGHRLSLPTPLRPAIPFRASHGARPR